MIHRLYSHQNTLYVSSKENYPNKTIDFTQTYHHTKHQNLWRIRCYITAQSVGQHVGAIDNRELKQKAVKEHDAHSKFHSN
jgi:hypothetical protein